MCFSAVWCLIGFAQNDMQKTLSVELINTNNEPIAFAEVLNKTDNFRFISDINGKADVRINSLPTVLEISATGYQTLTVQIDENTNMKLVLKITLEKDVLGLDEVVVTGTRNRISKRDSPIIVSTVNSKKLASTQSNNLAEGIIFTPGVRVETNCQNCGFTQVRLNGLEGSYTQILVNSRPIFSSLLGVYGLEQIPANSIQNIEIVRGGGSALYGSNAIAGTVNVITKDPVLNSWDISSTLGIIDGQSTDARLDFNTSVVADDLRSGVTLFGNYRNREAYDANGDGFTELVRLRTNSIGAKAYLKPTDLSRLSLNLNTLKEYRRGGDRLDLAPQFADISEELEHDTFIAGLDYEVNSEDQTKNLNVYSSISTTNRDSYYGGLGGGRTEADSTLANNAFGNTKDLALSNGFKYTKRYSQDNNLVLGGEFNLNDTEDEIPGYNRLIDQNVANYGVYAQYKHKFFDRLTALAGIRLDHVVVDGLYEVQDISRTVDLDQTALSPRVTMAYDITKNHKLRAGYARGFRAPQAFNEDLHISSVGGEQLFVILSEDLETEYSDAFTLSYDWDYTKNLTQLELLIEGFYTRLQNPFTQVSTGETLDGNAIIEEVRNGEGAEVYGVNLELNYSPNPKFIIQAGATLQDTAYDEPQLLFEPEDPTLTDVSIDSFVRNPNLYGFLNFNYLPNEDWNIDLSGTYTGTMTVPFVVDDTGFIVLNEVNDFFDVNLRLNRNFKISDSFDFSIFGGVKNIFNSYQDDFDIGPERDSDYVYGPAMPRMLFFGIKFGQF